MAFFSDLIEIPVKLILMLELLCLTAPPADIADQIGGWATDGVGQGYGSGYPIEVLHRWLSKIVI